MEREKRIKNTVQDLIDTIGVTRPSLVKYAKCYNIDLKSFCIAPQEYFGLYLELHEEAFDFFSGKKDEINNFNQEFFSWKPVNEICESLNIGFDEFKEFYSQNATSINSFYQNTPVKLIPSGEIGPETKISNISTQYLIHLFTQFPQKKSRTDFHENHGAPFKSIIGYHDIKESVIDLLNPIVDSKALDLWGLRKPGGIILFGPPGCGKTFWAIQIAEYLGFDFKEVPRSSFASSLVDGATKALKEILDSCEPRTVLFFDEFDSVAETRSTTSSGSRENVKVVNTLLQEIPKLLSRDIVIIAATNYLSRIDAAVIRPGRFDLKIPIFPPNQLERSEIIFFKLKKDLRYKSPLSEILERNNILAPEYFSGYSEKMKLFSTSLLEDFVDTLKRRLKYLYDSGSSIEEIDIDSTLLNEVISLTSAKLVKQDLEFLANFYIEVDSFLGSGIYVKRLIALKQELQAKYKGKKDPPRPIGFRRPNIEKC